jgi:hypothetical protein
VLESVSTDSRIIRKNAVHASQGGGRFTGMPCMTLRLRIRYRTLKLRALCWVLRRMHAVDYRKYREKSAELEFKMITIKPSSIIIATYGSLAAAAAVIISLAAAHCALHFYDPPRFRAKTRIRRSSSARHGTSLIED